LEEYESVDKNRNCNGRQPRDLAESSQKFAAEKKYALGRAPSCVFSVALIFALSACAGQQQGYYGNDRPYTNAPPPGDRWSQAYDRPYTYQDDSFYRECRNSVDPAGVIGGALIGGLLGNTLGRGNGRAGATVAGVIVGGVVGAALTRDLDCDDRSYAYRTYSDGFNAGRPDSRYTWQNPQNGHRGDFYVRDYYEDRYGFRCANFQQTIWINGRQEEATGRACRQPDGTWAIVS